MYAKIKESNVLVYPYDFKNLYDENPNTAFDFAIPIEESYSKTEDAISSGASIVSVEVAQKPSFDVETEKCVYRNAPELVDGSWILLNDVVKLNQAELNHRKQVAEVAKLGADGLPLPV